MPMDESLFLVSAPDTAGAPVDAFCLGVVQVHEVDHIDLFTNKRTVFTSSSSSGTSGADAAEQQQMQQQSHRQWTVTSVNP
jgi:hypothetical protein